MSDPQEIIGFFSYARQDDAESDGFLSNLRAEIQRNLRSQLGIPAHKLKLFQDKETIPPGALWQASIEAAIAESSFFILIVSPTALNSVHCKTEFDAFLARERQLGRRNLIFPIVCFPRTGLGDKSRKWPPNQVRDIIAAREYVDWEVHRHDRAIEDKEFRRIIADWCGKIVDALEELTVAQAEAADREVATHRYKGLVDDRPRTDEPRRGRENREADDTARQTRKPAISQPPANAEPPIPPPVPKPAAHGPPPPPPRLTPAQATIWRNAHAGSHEAQFYLARMYETGDGLAKSMPDAADWYRKAADQSNPAAMYNLGLILAGGQGVPQDEAAAVALYRKAAEQNYGNAQCQLAWMLEQGRGVARNEEEAVGFYRRAIANNDAGAHNNLAIMLSAGRGAPKDEKAAAELYRRAIALGVEVAKSNLALLPQHVREPRTVKQA